MGRAPESVSKAVPQENAPVNIVNYTAYYDEGSPSEQEGISHSVLIRNNSNNSVVAVELAFVEFDVWNQHLGKALGLSRATVEKGKTDGVSWQHTPYGAGAFQTGVAWVSRVRFADGTIWTADIKTILPALFEIQKDFDANELKKKDTQPGRLIRGNPAAHAL